MEQNSEKKKTNNHTHTHMGGDRKGPEGGLANTLGSAFQKPRGKWLRGKPQFLEPLA